jgi:hypothetical protein
MRPKTFRIIIKVMWTSLWLVLILVFNWLILVVGAYFIAKNVVRLILWWNNYSWTYLQRYYNTHIYGFKRRGKDASTQLAIVKRFKGKYLKVRRKFLKMRENIDLRYSDMRLWTWEDFEKLYYFYYPNYLSNIDYGYGCRVIDLKELELRDKNSGKYLTYDDIIEGKVKLMNIEKNPTFEGKDLILSDSQIGLPNTEHNKLDSKYPWLGPFIAIAGQLYDMIISINSQEFERPWVKIRGQQDYYMRAIKTFPLNKTKIHKMRNWLPIINKWLFIKIRTYTELESAKQGVLPFKAVGAINEGGKTLYLTSGQATKEQFKATHGEIKERWIRLKYKDIRYDSRVYHEIVFGEKAPKN